MGPAATRCLPAWATVELLIDHHACCYVQGVAEPVVGSPAYTFTFGGQLGHGHPECRLQRLATS
ncbi:hypothetical protein [Streptomyces malaysiensis]|uniref:hypothetical protein n=1 Tax=Streptomyces malaysiensis TaxID=92644 RepID=UPI0011E4C9F9|nr:hypothetical protein [Streptomyces autolyticus]